MKTSCKTKFEATNSSLNYRCQASWWFDSGGSIRNPNSFVPSLDFKSFCATFPRVGFLASVWITGFGALMADDFNQKVANFLKSEEGQKAVFEAVTNYARKEQARAQERAREEAEKKREEQFKNPVQIPVGDSPVIGNPNAKITIVEFSDFECPFCKRGAQTVQEVLDKFGDEVRVVFKHRPLDFHKNAKEAHKAAWAAAKLGKFKEAKAFLFDNQNRLGDAKLYEELSKHIGVDERKFRDLMSSKDAEKAIEEDGKLADQLGVQGTPTFFINGVILEGAYPFDEFSKIINRWREKLNKKG